jgi:hypothetical protein
VRLHRRRGAATLLQHRGGQHGQQQGRESAARRDLRRRRAWVCADRVSGMSFRRRRLLAPNCPVTPRRLGLRA